MASDGTYRKREPCYQRGARESAHGVELQFPHLKNGILHLLGSELRLCRIIEKKGQLVVVGCKVAVPATQGVWKTIKIKRERELENPDWVQKCWLPFPSHCISEVTTLAWVFNKW